MLFIHSFAQISFKTVSCIDDDFGLTDNWQISRVHYVHLKICYVYFSF